MPRREISPLPVFYVPAYISVYPPVQDTDHVKATDSYYSGVTGFTWLPFYATNPANSLVGPGSPWGNEGNWLVGLNNSALSGCRFHIDLGTAKRIQRIYYENYHASGTGVISGAKDFTFWGSNDAGAFANLVYATDTNWTQLTTDVSVFEQHVAVDISDPKYVLVTNGNAYRYYCIKAAPPGYDPGNLWGLRRIELQIFN